MIAAIRSEFVKFFTTRMWWAMALAVFAAGALFAALNVYVYHSFAGQDGFPEASAAQAASAVYTGGIGISYALLLAIGVLSIGQEYRHQTITTTFLAVPRRVRAMSAKVISLIGIGALYGVVSMAGAVVVGAIGMRMVGMNPFPDLSVARSLALSLLVLGLWALIGLGGGILMKNQVLAIFVLIAVTFIVEPILLIVMAQNDFLAQHVVGFLPSQASTSALGQVSTGSTDAPMQSLSWWAGALVLASYAAVMTGVGMLLTRRVDIT